MPPLPPESIEHRALHAVRRHAREGRLFAGADTLGLPAHEFVALCREAGIATAPPRDVEHDERPAWLDAMIALLWDERSEDGPLTRLMVGAIASACFGERHLWEELGLRDRVEVTALLDTHVAGLARANWRGWKWKRYLFDVLGGRAGAPALQPPRCDECDEHGACFAHADVHAPHTRPA